LRRKLDVLVGLKCKEKNKPFGQQHQFQFDFNPALVTTLNTLNALHRESY